MTTQVISQEKLILKINLLIYKMIKLIINLISD